MVEGADEKAGFLEISLASDVQREELGFEEKAVKLQISLKILRGFRLVVLNFYHKKGNSRGDIWINIRNDNFRSQQF